MTGRYARGRARATTSPAPCSAPATECAAGCCATSSALGAGTADQAWQRAIDKVVHPRGRGDGAVRIQRRGLPGRPGADDLHLPTGSSARKPTATAMATGSASACWPPNAAAVRSGLSVATRRPAPRATAACSSSTITSTYARRWLSTRVRRGERCWQGAGRSSR